MHPRAFSVFLCAAAFAAACSSSDSGDNSSPSTDAGSGSGGKGSGGAAVAGGATAAGGAQDDAGPGGAAAGGRAAGGAPGAGGASACSGTECGTACCAATAVCFDDGAGNLSCATKCTKTSDCPPAKPVCSLLEDGTSGCTADFGAPQRCAAKADCASGEECAPKIDDNGNPIGPYVCVPNDGDPYHGCRGVLTTCGNGYCCVTDAKANQFCATPCQNTSQCGGSTCMAYDMSQTTCSATKACGAP